MYLTWNFDYQAYNIFVQRDAIQGVPLKQSLKKMLYFSHGSTDLSMFIFSSGHAVAH